MAGIPRGQNLRLRRICYSNEDFKQEARKLYQRFKSQGYKTRCPPRAYQLALAHNREDLLYKSQRGITQKGISKNQRNTSIGDVLTHSHFQKHSRTVCCKTPGNFKCGAHEQCHLMKFTYLPAIVGKMKRPLKRRIYEHIRDIKNCNLLSAIAKHIYCIHNGQYTGSYFQGIDRLHGDIRGGDLENKLLQLETTWIFRLNTYKSELGLNGHLNFQVFVNR
ncbi:hypothetical protein XELAEV_18020074mg [Xenopus laevis]|uniref:Helix-turn-helix domain-containing protein n=1 Tax=Xenopus laevis TaxID=8355 RepID=A0A974D720_XENLA|nr:hypothetical protein XELAEV_18020074mg [Xenopus laevis]